MPATALGSEAYGPLGQWESRDGGFRIVLIEAPSPLPLNQSHGWRIRVTDSQGEPFEPAALTVVGGMPQHGHGFPAAPRLSPGKRAGEYDIEGMRFHMPGAWQVGFTVIGKDGVPYEVRREFVVGALPPDQGQ